MDFFRVNHSHITDDRGFYIGPYSHNDEYLSQYGHHGVLPTNSTVGYYSMAANSWPVEINGEEYHEYEFLCGFSSVRVLREWFIPQSLTKLRKNKFVIRKYTIDYIIPGREQAFALADEIIHLENRQEFELIPTT